jgi:mannose-6-phosphate isomerase-like protein (cupin superfamily)
MNTNQTIEPIDTPDHVNFPIASIDPKGWGVERVIINCYDYCAKILEFKVGQDGSTHFHSKKHETWYILEGELRFVWIDTTDAEQNVKVLKSGDIVDIPRLCPHKVIALTDVRIMEVSTPHYIDDSYRVFPGASQRRPAVATQDGAR